MKRKRNVLLALALLLTPALVVAQDATPEVSDAVAGPDQIVIAEAGLMPEGIAWDPVNETFLVGSLSQGNVYRVADDGTLTPLTDSENLSVSVGLEVDAERNRVLAAGIGPGQNGAALGAYDLDTGEELFYVDLAPLSGESDRHFANDVAVDEDGNAYVTDSAAGVIYRVDVDGNADIFLSDPSFLGQFVLNGIAYNPDGYLVAVRSPDLMKIPLDDPQAFTIVETGGDVSSGDGITFADDETLVLVSGRRQVVQRIESHDDFMSATITAEFEPQPISATTAAVRGDDVYVVHARFSEPTAAEYPIDRVSFAEIEAQG